MNLDKIKLFIILFSSILYGQNNDFFDKANELYNEGKYYDAIENYNLILDDGKHSQELYYNLGNSYYKLNDIANSIFYFEKGLILNPNNEKIINNLAYAQNMLIDKIEPLPKNQILSFFNDLVNLVSYESWQIIYIFFEYLALIFFLLYLFSFESKRKKTFFIISSICIFLFFSTILLADFSKNNYRNNNPAIIFDKQVELRVEPNLRSEVVYTLHEGTKLNVTESINEWSEVKLSNGNKGWLTTSSFRLIK